MDETPWAVVPVVPVVPVSPSAPTGILYARSSIHDRRSTRLVADRGDFREFLGAHAGEGSLP